MEDKRMGNKLQLLITAGINAGLSIREINRGLKQLSKHPSLQKLQVGISIDKKAIQSIEEFNRELKKITQANNQQEQSTKKSTDAVQRETEAVKRNTQVLKDNEAIRTKITTAPDGASVRTDITTGNRFDSTTTGQTVNADGSFVEHPSVRTINEAGLREAQKKLEDFTKSSEHRLRELRRHFGNFNKDIAEVSKSMSQLNETSSPRDYKRVEDQIKKYEALQKQQISAVRNFKRDAAKVDVDYFKTLKTNQERREAIDKAHYTALRQNEAIDLQRQRAAKKEAEAIDRAHYMALKTEKQRIEAMDKMHYIALKQNRDRDLKIKKAQQKEAEMLDRAHYMALKTHQQRKEAQEKMHYIALEQNRQRDLKLQKQYETIRKSMELQSVGLLGQPRVRKSEVESVMRELRSFNKITPQSIERARELQHQFRMIGAEARGAAVSTNTFAGAFRNAIIKFPIWMAASTAFFGVTRGIRSSLQNIIAIDSELTTLRRVMDDTTNFNGMLEDGIRISNELGKSLKDTMSAMTGFARQGYNEEQVAHLTRTSQLMTNISELNAEDSMSTMTAAMTIFNIEASRSIEIVDKLNEIDNNFALTTEQLSASLRKAGSTAVAFGKLNAA